MTLLSTDHIFSHNLPNFCKYFFRRTSAGKICLACQRPSKKIIRHFSEGRRQDFSIDHKVFTKLSKNFRNYFLRRTSAVKIWIISNIKPCLMISIYFEWRQQDKVKFHWHKAPPKCRPSSFLVVDTRRPGLPATVGVDSCKVNRRHSSGSGAPPKGSTLDNLNRAAAAAAAGAAKKLLRWGWKSGSK